MAASRPDHSATNDITDTQTPRNTAEYLLQLIEEREKLLPNMFPHMKRLADEEIIKVRASLVQMELIKEQVALPEAEGEIQRTKKKVFIPTEDFPGYNFVGKILGPRGMTKDQLEQETGCKIMIRGRGSFKNHDEEKRMMGMMYGHIYEELHVLIICDDTPNRSSIKIDRAVAEINKLLVPQPFYRDMLKKRQMMELAVINGVVEEGNHRSRPRQNPRFDSVCDTYMSALQSGSSSTLQ